LAHWWRANPTLKNGHDTRSEALRVQFAVTQATDTRRDAKGIKDAQNTCAIEGWIDLACRLRFIYRLDQ